LEFLLTNYNFKISNQNKTSQKLNSSYESVIKNLNNFLSLDKTMDMKELLNSYSNFENECDELYQLIVNNFQLNV
jgi:hypothetical protein